MAQQSLDDDGLYAVTIQCENVGDFYVDDERLSGDWYGYGLTRHTLRLAPGSKHTLSVRVVHEVRIFGGTVLPPPSKFRCELAVPSFALEDDHEGIVKDLDGVCSSLGPALMVQVVKEGYGGYVVMDAVGKILAGEYISVALRNVGPRSVLVKSVRVVKGFEFLRATLANSDEPISLYPSVHRPIAIRLQAAHGAGVNLVEGTTGELAFTLEFELESVAVVDSNKHKVMRGTLRTCTLMIAQRKWGEPYKYTFLDFDGTVQYAVAIPPSRPKSNPTDSAPVLVSLHGAGVEVDQSPFWLSEYTQRERTWIVLPTGRSPWKSKLSRGYDWHGASMKNVASAVESLASNLYGVPEHLKNLPGMRPDPERLLMAGHSNGGQGAWFMVSHYPDKAIAATPAAGYVSIKQYVPFTGWLSNSYSDSHLRGILTKKAVYHFFAASQKYQEPDTGLREFSMTTKGAVKVKIVRDEQQGGSIEPSNTWIVETTNIRRLRFLDSPSLRIRRGEVSMLILDGVRFDISQNNGAFSLATLPLGSFVREENNKGPRWQFTSSREWIKTERHRETYGPAIQILEKKIVIVVGTHFDSPQIGRSDQGKYAMTRAVDRIAKLISHDIYLYGRGDVEIVTDKDYRARIDDILAGNGAERPNLVLIGDHHQNFITKLVLAQTEQQVTIDCREGLVSILPGFDHVVETEYRQAGTGLLMIRPWGTHNLAMVIAGLDVQGLETAARLFPKRTGLLVPDWVVTGPEMAWKGAGGILAAGYWGNRWEYLPSMSA
ncbi:hypothetical protein EC968_010288 [Mortierella alpina]|nr:hypothetical protein EC968_010288 [Mortierella alpina]